MKTWLRLTLITVTVGGGFAGVVVTLQALLGSQGQRAFNLPLMCVFLLLYVYVTVSGLLFVHKPEQTRPLIAALAIQIPWISSSLIVYKFAAALHAVFSIRSPEAAGLRFDTEILLGSGWRFAWLQENPWSIGINLFPLAILLLLWR
jgi:hypothetical protein